MAWSPAEVEEIIELMRAGAGVMTGGSRCHSSYYFRDGAWRREDFDEGHTQEVEIAEATIRAMIVDDPQRFAGVLQAPRWEAFSAAYLAGAPEARPLLHAALVYGDQFEHGKILDAVLAGPDEPLEPAVAELIRKEIRGYTAYHCFMGAALWDRSPAVARFGVAFVDRLRELVGDAPGVFTLRASFLEQAEQPEAAIAELERELGQTPDGPGRASVEARLARLRGEPGTTGP